MDLHPRLGWSYRPAWIDAGGQLPLLLGDLHRLTAGLGLVLGLPEAHRLDSIALDLAVQVHREVGGALTVPEPDGSSAQPAVVWSGDAAAWDGAWAVLGGADVSVRF